MKFMYSPFNFNKYICLGIFTVSFLFYLLFSSLVPITDPVESNYALTAKEMVISGDWLSPRIYGKAWFDKPVLFYWLTAIAFKIFGFSDITARLVPAVFAGIGITLIYWFVMKVSRQSTAILAALIMGTSLEYVLLAKLIITDMVFFVFNNAALVFFYLGYSRESQKWYFLMYACMALAVLTKGPVGLVLPSIVIVIFIFSQHDWEVLRAMSLPAGILIFATIAMPWYMAMYAVHGSEFLNTFIGVHNYLRATVSEHPADNVGYYYIIVFFLSMLPWSPLVLRAIVNKRKELFSRKSPLISFSLIWVLVYFVFYSIMATKYLTYTFPMVFPLALVAAHYLEQILAEEKRRTIFCWLGLPIILVTLIYIAVSCRYLSGMRLLGNIGFLLLVIVLGIRQAKRQPLKHTAGLICLCQAAIYITLSISVFPALAYTRSEKQLAQNIISYNEQKLAFYDFYSTSAVYYSGKVAVKITPDDKSQQKNQQLSWDKKYTMPNESMSALLANSPNETILVVVPNQKQSQFLTESQKYKPKLLQSTEQFSYYYLDS